MRDLGVSLWQLFFLINLWTGNSLTHSFKSLLSREWLSLCPTFSSTKEVLLLSVELWSLLGGIHTHITHAFSASGEKSIVHQVWLASAAIHSGTDLYRSSALSTMTVQMTNAFSLSEISSCKSL